MSQKNLPLNISKSERKQMIEKSLDYFNSPNFSQ